MIAEMDRHTTSVERRGAHVEPYRSFAQLWSQVLAILWIYRPAREWVVDLECISCVHVDRA